VLNIRVPCFFYKSEGHYFWISPGFFLLLLIVPPSPHAIPHHPPFPQSHTWCFVLDLWRHRKVLGILTCHFSPKICF
jgi:hypothetical protein